MVTITLKHFKLISRTLLTNWQKVVYYGCKILSLQQYFNTKTYGEFQGSCIIITASNMHTNWSIGEAIGKLSHINQYQHFASVHISNVSPIIKNTSNVSICLLLMKIYHKYIYASQLLAGRDGVQLYTLSVQIHGSQ